MDAEQVVRQSEPRDLFEAIQLSRTSVDEASASRSTFTDTKPWEHLPQLDFHFSDGALEYSIRNMFMNWYRTTSTTNHTVTSYITFSFEIRESWHPYGSGLREIGIRISDGNGNPLTEVKMGGFLGACKVWKHINLQKNVDPKYFDAGQMATPFGSSLLLSPCP